MGSWGGWVGVLLWVQARTASREERGSFTGVLHPPDSKPSAPPSALMAAARPRADSTWALTPGPAAPPRPGWTPGCCRLAQGELLPRLPEEGQVLRHQLHQEFPAPGRQVLCRALLMVRILTKPGRCKLHPCPLCEGSRRPVSWASPSAASQNLEPTSHFVCSVIVTAELHQPHPPTFCFAGSRGAQETPLQGSEARL